MRLRMLCRDIAPKHPLRLRGLNVLGSHDMDATVGVRPVQHNQQPKPFVRTAKAADILAKVMRGRATLNTVQSG